MGTASEIAATNRTDMGRSACRRMRREGKVPAIIYGSGQESTPITLEHKVIAKAASNESFYSKILTLAVDGKKQKVVVKQIERHPFKPKIAHLDFLRINPNEKLTMHIPIHFSKDELCPGVKEEEGVVSHHLNEIEVRCLPADLPEFIAVDLSGLKLNEIFHLSQIEMPSGVEIMAFTHGDIEEHDTPVASVHPPHVEQEPDEKATDDGEAKADSEDEKTTDAKKD